MSLISICLAFAFSLSTTNACISGSSIALKPFSYPSLITLWRLLKLVLSPPSLLLTLSLISATFSYHSINSNLLYRSSVRSNSNLKSKVSLISCWNTSLRCCCSRWSSRKRVTRAFQQSTSQRCSLSRLTSGLLISKRSASFRSAR